MIDFSPNCTFPTTSPSGFVLSSNIRSTMDIIWSCMSIIVLSTWSVLHLTVPPDIKPRFRSEWMRKQTYLLWRKLAWMGIMLAFPEYLVSICTTNLFSSLVNNPSLEKLAEVDNVPWSFTHTVLANMGGIAIRFSEPTQQPAEEEQRQLRNGVNDLLQPGRISSVEQDADQRPQSRTYDPESQAEKGNPRFTKSNVAEPKKSSALKTSNSSKHVPKHLTQFCLNQDRYLEKLGEIAWAQFAPHVHLAANSQIQADWPSQNVDMATLQGNIWILDSKQLVLAREHGVIKKLPSLTKEEIQDRSKSDGLVRLLAVIQLLWLAAQLVIRRINRIPFAALEISTLAFSSCAIIIYIMEWRKPKDVGVPIYLSTDTIVSPHVFSLIARAAPVTFIQTRRYYIPQSSTHQLIEGRFERKHLDRLMILTSILSIALFGGIHLFAWNLDFPTSIERILWRVSALTVAIAPSISALLVLFESVVRHRTDQLSKWSVMFLAPFYLAARSFIIVESIRSLYFLPPAAFISTWVTNAPHFE